VSVQDQVHEKNIALVVKAGKLTAKTLAKAMRQFLASKPAGKTANKSLTAQTSMGKTGKQTVKQLVGQGAGVSNIEISDKNIKAFESIARKYGVDFAVKKDASETPPKWLVFFKGRDADAITAAFKEFSAKQLIKTAEKPSVLANLRNLMEKVKNQVLDVTKHKERGNER